MASLSQFYINNTDLESRQICVDLLTRAASHGIPIAQHNLAALYLQDAEIPGKNVEFGIEYYKMAAAQGFQDSIKFLAENGIDT